VNSKIQHIALACLFCIGVQSLAQAPTGQDSAPGVIADPFVMTWKPNCPGCDDRYENGLEEKGLFTNQASIIVFLIPDSGKLAISVYVGNPAESTGRIDVNPDNFHLFKITEKGLSELKRAEAVKMAKSMERRERIGAAIGGAGASFSQTTATGTATYSDGTTADYTVTLPNPQAQTDAINRGQANIREAQSQGAHLIDKELKRNTLNPGQNTMGRLFFPNQKSGDNLLLRADIGNARYEIPFHLPGKHEAKVASSATQRDDSRPPQPATATTVDTGQQTMPTDSVQQAAWYRKAADQGDAIAQSKLGWLYATGHGVPQDYAQAVAWFRKAAEQGKPGAQFNLGWAYEAGQGVPQDYVQAAGWYRKAADQGEADALLNLGWLYDKGHGVAQDYVQAAALFRKAAEQGNPQAQYNLGRLYGKGQGVMKDFAQALAWYQKAADQGYTGAQFNLGWAYYNGQGVPQDYAQAATWFRKAADQGDAGAQNNLGDLYENGHGVPQDYEQAAAWYRKAADKGNAVAQFGLGSLYFGGHGVQQDYAEAYFWLNLAAASSKGKEQERFAKSRDEAAAKLIPDDLSRTQQRAAAWFAAHPPKS
jgi:TPR repeat protein